MRTCDRALYSLACWLFVRRPISTIVACVLIAAAIPGAMP